MSTSPSPFTLSVAIETAHLRQDQAPLPQLARLAQQASDAGSASLVLRDRLVQPGGQATGLDAGLAAAALGPVTHGVGLVAEVSGAVTEPFHTATATQTADFASLGRAGLLLSPALDEEQHRAVGRWPEALRSEPAELSPAVLQDAADTLEAIARLWESWEADAEIRDTATGRFLDRERIHNADFAGATFTLEGASITPRSPQGRPPLFLSADSPATATLAGQRADVALLVAPVPAQGTPVLDAAWAASVGELANAVLAEAAGERSAWAEDPAPLLWVQLPPGVSAEDAAAAVASLLAAGVPLSGALLTAASGWLEGQRLHEELGATRTALAAHGLETTAPINSAAGATLRASLGLRPARNPHTLSRTSDHTVPTAPAHQEA